MKRIMILGSTGCAGHMISKYFKMFKKQYDVFDVSRDGLNHFNVNLYDNTSILLDAMNTYKPHVIVNCVGLLIEQSNSDINAAIYINSLFPHWLEEVTKNTDIKIIHISTDCIFNGDNVYGYNEYDIPTETNWYGRTKALGELNNKKDLTLRLSIIGPELKRKTGLFEWFNSQIDSCYGYKNVEWNGITTLELAKQIKLIIEKAYTLTGIYHLAPNTSISKFNLLSTIKAVFNLDINIVPSIDKFSNKVLLNNRVEEYFPNIPGYIHQLQELKRFYYKNK